MHNDHEYMKRAIELASDKIGLASPNPAVGCVIVKNGQVIGEGAHEYSLKDHAEIAALQMAGNTASGATAYVTLEPCSHQGRTPPCALRLIASGVRRVVIPRIDPNPRVSGQGVAILRNAGILVDVGLLAEESGLLIEPFACHVTTGRPLVVSKAGMSLDGRIATFSKSDRWITSVEAREFGQTLRLKMDAILVGIGTVLADDPELTYRGSLPRARALLRVILDSHLRTPPEARMFHVAQAPVWIFCAPGAPAPARLKLEAAGAEVIPVPTNGKGLDLNLVLDELGKRNILGVLVEGGSAVHWSFMSSALVDKFYFILAPFVLGGGAVPAIGGSGYPTIGEAPRFKVTQCFSVGPDLVLETYPSFSRSIITPWNKRNVNM